jgi:hypothetical protein
LDLSFTIAEILLFLLIFFILGICSLVKTLKHIKKTYEKESYLEIFMILVIVPAIISFIYIYKNKYNISMEDLKILDFTKNTYMIPDKDTICIAILASVIETIILLIIPAESSPKNTHVIIKNDYASYFVYSKIDKNYLICGDSYDMKDANNIVTISINDIYERKYSLSIYKDESDNKDTILKKMLAWLKSKFEKFKRNH